MGGGRTDGTGGTGKRWNRWTMGPVGYKLTDVCWDHAGLTNRRWNRWELESVDTGERAPPARVDVVVVSLPHFCEFTEFLGDIR